MTFGCTDEGAASHPRQLQFLTLTDSSCPPVIWGYFGLARESVRFAIDFRLNCPDRQSRYLHLQEALDGRRVQLSRHEEAVEKLRRDVSLLEKAVRVSTI